MDDVGMDGRFAGGGVMKKMKKTFLLPILLLVLQSRAFEIRYKWISFGTDIAKAYEDLIGKLPDTLEQSRLADSLMASSPCVNKHDTIVRDCDARGWRHYYTKTPYECCLIRTLGYRIDSINTLLNVARSRYTNYAVVRKDLQISEHILIRERDYLATLYFNRDYKAYGYIVYAGNRNPGDPGLQEDVDSLYKFMSDKYGKPLTKNERIVLPTRAGGKFEYATWSQQNCAIKVSIVSDGRQVWVQESVLNKTYLK